jgi:AcrR family transcriptional regulator
MLQNSPTDLRIRRTHKLLRDALIVLMDDHDYADIQITHLCERAMVNRATFYRHFADKDDLLAHCMDDVLDELVRQANPAPTQAEEVSFQAGYQNLELIFTHVAAYARFYQVMLRHSKSGAFRARVERYLQSVLDERWQHAQNAHPQPPQLPPPMIIAYQAAVILGLIYWWVDHDCRETPAYMAAAAFHLMLHGLGWALGMQAAGGIPFCPPGAE